MNAIDRQSCQLRTANWAVESAHLPPMHSEENGSGGQKTAEKSATSAVLFPRLKVKFVKHERRATLRSGQIRRFIDGVETTGLTTN